MAVELIATSVHIYQGMENDPKPTDVPVGSRFMDTDGRQRTWRFTDGQWKPWNEEADIASVIVSQTARLHADNEKY